jgi:hypothetical protein
MVFTKAFFEDHAGHIFAVTKPYIASYCVLQYGNVVRRLDHVDWMFHGEGRRIDDLFSATPLRCLTYLSLTVALDIQKTDERRRSGPSLLPNVVDQYQISAILFYQQGIGLVSS